MPIVRLDESRTSAGASPAAGYKWEIPIDAIYFNGKHLENTTETSPEISPNGTYLALVDTGNPAMVFPPDMMSQIVGMNWQLQMYSSERLMIASFDRRTHGQPILTIALCRVFMGIS